MEYLQGVIEMSCGFFSSFYLSITFKKNIFIYTQELAARVYYLMKYGKFNYGILKLVQYMWLEFHRLKDAFWVLLSFKCLKMLLTCNYNIS